MGVSEIRREIEALDHQQQKELLGFLVLLELRREQGWREETARKLDDTSPGKWFPIEEVETRLGMNSENGD